MPGGKRKRGESSPPQSASAGNGMVAVKGSASPDPVTDAREGRVVVAKTLLQTMLCFWTFNPNLCEIIEAVLANLTHVRAKDQGVTTELDKVVLKIKEGNRKLAEDENVHKLLLEQQPEKDECLTNATEELSAHEGKGIFSGSYAASDSNTAHDAYNETRKMLKNKIAECSEDAMDHAKKTTELYAKITELKCTLNTLKDKKKRLEIEKNHINEALEKLSEEYERLKALETKKIVATFKPLEPSMQDAPAPSHAVPALPPP